MSTPTPVINQQLDTLNAKMDKHNALMEVMAASALKELKEEWSELEQLASSGLFGEAYDIGTYFTDTWQDKATTTDYTNPFQLNHIGNVELEDGETLVNRPFLQAHYAHPFGVQFSHQRALVMVAFKVTSALSSGTTYYWTRQSDSKTISFKAPSAISVGQWLTLNNGYIEIYDTNGNLAGKTAATIGTSTSGTSLGNSPVFAAGNYYFTFAANWGTHVVANDVVSFTTTDALQFGDRLCGCYGAPDQAKTGWKIYPVTSDGKTLGTALDVGSSSSGTNLGAMGLSSRSTTGSYFLNSIHEMAYGWNRWKFSAIRQYLNSAAGVGAWWTAQDGFDVRPDELSTKAGYLSGWSEDFVEAIKAVKVITYPNTVQDDTGGNTPDITYDKVFLPSLEQMYINPQKAGEGEFHEYWKRRSGRSTVMGQYETYPNIITYGVDNHTSAQHVRLRSAYRGLAYYTWYVYSSGYVSYGRASHSYRFAPLVVL